MTRLLALLGNPVAHTLSPRIQNRALEAAGFDAVYVALPTDGASLSGLLRGIALSGGAGNVTLPHKQAAVQAVDRSSVTAQRIGAVNTFWQQEGFVWGDNTDVAGVCEALGILASDGPSLSGARVVVLGSGGAARAALVALEQLGVGSVVIRSRRPAIAADMLRQVAPGMSSRVEPWDAPFGAPIDLLLNATPLGLHDHDPLPVPASDVPPATRVMDLVYHPRRTAWVRALSHLGIPAMDGGEMLVGQGKASFFRWWGTHPPEGVFEATLEEIRTEHVSS